MTDLKLYQNLVLEVTSAAINNHSTVIVSVSAMKRDSFIANKVMFTLNMTLFVTFLISFRVNKTLNALKRPLFRVNDEW